MTSGSEPDTGEGSPSEDERSRSEAAPAADGSRNRLTGSRLFPVVLLIAGAVLLAPFIVAGVDIGLSALDLSRGSGSDEVSPAVLKGERDRIVIPSIQLDSSVSSNLDELDRKIIRYGFSAEPGRSGNVVMTGHNLRKSGNPLFSLLFMVEKNNKIFLVHGGKAYSYRVKKKEIVSISQAERFAATTGSEQLTLITCYPPTVDTMRLVVVAVR